MATSKEFEDIPVALKVVVELKPLCDRRWLSRKINDYGKEIFLKSVARRAKEFPEKELKRTFMFGSQA